MHRDGVISTDPYSVEMGRILYATKEAAFALATRLVLVATSVSEDEIIRVNGAIYRCCRVIRGVIMSPPYGSPSC